MKYALIMTGVLGVIVPAQHASATQYYYCYTKVYNKDKLIHYTPVLSTEDDDIDERQTGFAFSDFAKSTAFSNGSIDTGCSSSSRLDVATRNYRSMLSAGQGSGRQVDWPNPPVPSQIATALPDEVSITSDSRSGPVSDMPSADRKKYVEVAGPNGTIRLSPEVAARNQAAAEEYRRKMEAHAREKADHDRKMTEYQESRARAGRALGDHAAQLRAQQDEHQRQLREHAARVEGRDSDSPCARYRRSNGAGWKVNPCV